MSARSKNGRRPKTMLAPVMFETITMRNGWCYIARGVRGERDQCPLAIAFAERKDLSRFGKWWWVDRPASCYDYWEVSAHFSPDGGQWLPAITLPDISEAFDVGRPVQAITFEIQVP